MIFKQKNRYPILLSGLFGLIAAFYSIGYFHPDEHYQILEFLSFKLERGQLSNLPWEYQAQIRPWIQPFIYFLISKVFGFLDLNSPYVLENIFRFMSVALFQFSLWKLTFYSVKKYDLNEKRTSFLIFFTGLFWVFPFLSARISSEVVGGALFFIGLIGSLESFESSEGQKSNRNIFLYSFLIGISVWIRFQLGAAVLGYLIWYGFFSKKYQLKPFLMIAGGVVIASVIGILIDFWGYGEFVITPIKYFSRNILEGEAAKHGVTPWWEYFYISQKKLHPGIGALFVLSFFYHWGRYFKDIFTISMLTFFLLHMGTSHKELRFLYPMAMLIPTYFVVLIKDFELDEKIPKRFGFVLSLLLFIYFFLGSIKSSTRSPYQGIGAIKFLQQNNIKKLYTFSSIPFKKLSHNINQSYYGDNITEEINVNSFKDLDSFQIDDSFYVGGRGGRQALLFQENGCQEVYPNHSRFYFWIQYSRKFYKQDFHSIYFCVKKVIRDIPQE